MYIWKYSHRCRHITMCAVFLYKHIEMMEKRVSKLIFRMEWNAWCWVCSIWAICYGKQQIELISIYFCVRRSNQSNLLNVAGIKQANKLFRSSACVWFMLSEKTTNDVIVSIVLSDRNGPDGLIASFHIMQMRNILWSFSSGNWIYTLFSIVKFYLCELSDLHGDADAIAQCSLQCGAVYMTMASNGRCWTTAGHEINGYQPKTGNKLQIGWLLAIYGIVFRHQFLFFVFFWLLDSIF